MRLIAAAATALLCAATIVFAQDADYSDGRDGSQSFTGLRGSLDFNGHLSGQAATTPPTTIKASSGGSSGGGASVYWGWRLPYGFKTELEVLYRALPLTKASINGVAGTMSGHANTAGPMLNLTWTPPVDVPLGIRPFIGGGVGYLWNEVGVNALGTTSFPTTHDDSWHFGYNVMAGLSIPLSASSRLTGMYRWLHEDIDVNCGATLSCGARGESSSVELGLEMDL